MRDVLTKDSRLSPAKICRMNNWRAGSVLIGERESSTVSDPPEIKIIEVDLISVYIEILNVGDLNSLRADTMPIRGGYHTWDPKTRNWTTSPDCPVARARKLAEEIVAAAERWAGEAASFRLSKQTEYASKLRELIGRVH